MLLFIFFLFVASGFSCCSFVFLWTFHSCSMYFTSFNEKEDMIKGALWNFAVLCWKLVVS